DPDLLAEYLIIQRLVVQHLFDRDIPIKNIRAPRRLKIQLNPVLSRNHQCVNRAKVVEVFDDLIVIFLKPRGFVWSHSDPRRNLELIQRTNVAKGFGLEEDRDYQIRCSLLRAVSDDVQFTPVDLLESAVVELRLQLLDSQQGPRRRKSSPEQTVFEHDALLFEEETEGRALAARQMTRQHF